MSEAEDSRYALDDFDGRVPDDEIESWVERRPHPDAGFDSIWWSRHDPEGRTIRKAWRLVYACVAGCPDAVESMPATRDPDSHPKECPECGGPVSRLRRCWDVPISTQAMLYDDV